MTKVLGIVAYECDCCSTHHHCDAGCDRSELPDGWKSRDRYDIHVCPDCDLSETVKSILTEETL